MKASGFLNIDLIPCVFSDNLNLVIMTRISAKELVDDFLEDKFNGKVRDRSQESRIRESPNKRAYNEDSLVFETKIVDREGVEVTVGALGMLVEEANKLSWKHFKNYMVIFKYLHFDNA